MAWFRFTDPKGVVSFYNDDVHKPGQIPNGAVPITEEQWQAAITDPAVMSRPAPLVEPPPPSLPKMMSDLIDALLAEGIINATRATNLRNRLTK
jgi:hypothetical protein